MERIDFKNEHDPIDLVNLGWADYSNIMIAMDYLTKRLTLPIENEFYESHRIPLLKQYQELFEKMKSKNIPWRGTATSINDSVIIAKKNIVQIH